MAALMLRALLLSVHLWANSAVAVAPSPFQERAYPSSVSLDGELTAFLQHDPVPRPEVFFKAMTILESLETRPSCYRMAASSLLTSCQSLEKPSNGAGRNAESILDALNAKYAARLALCELTGAKASIPNDCKALVPSEAACKRQGLAGWFGRGEESEKVNDQLCYPYISESQFQSCLSALDGRPQSWTSYSNARQNALVMCQASRAAIEKEEQLETYKAMAGATAGLNAALSDSLRDAHSFATAVGKLHEDLLKEVDRGLEATRGSFSKIAADLLSATQSLMDRLSKSAENAGEKIQEMAAAADDTGSKLNGIQIGLQVLQDATTRRQSQLIVAQRESLHTLDTINLFMAAIGGTLEGLRNGTITELGGDVDALRGQLASLIIGVRHDQADFHNASAAHTEELKRRTEEFRRITSFSGMLGFAWNWAGIGIATATVVILLLGFVHMVSAKLAMCCTMAAVVTFSAVSAVSLGFAAINLPTMIWKACCSVTPFLSRAAFGKFWSSPSADFFPTGLHLVVAIMVVISIMCLLGYFITRWLENRGSLDPGLKESLPTRSHWRSTSTASAPPPYSAMPSLRWQYNSSDESKLQQVYYSEP